jgi:hypothetical protein
MKPSSRVLAGSSHASRRAARISVTALLFSSRLISERNAKSASRAKAASAMTLILSFVLVMF